MTVLFVFKFLETINATDALDLDTLASGNVDWCGGGSAAQLAAAQLDQQVRLGRLDALEKLTQRHQGNLPQAERWSKLIQQQKKALLAGKPDAPVK